MTPEQREMAKKFKSVNKKVLYEKLQSFGLQKDHYDQFIEKSDIQGLLPQDSNPSLG